MLLSPPHLILKRLHLSWGSVGHCLPSAQQLQHPLPIDNHQRRLVFHSGLEVLCIFFWQNCQIKFKSDQILLEENNKRHATISLQVQLSEAQVSVLEDWRTGPLLSQPPFEEEKTKTRRGVCSVRDGRVVTDSSGTHCHLHLSHLSRTRQEVDYVDLWVRFFPICMCLQFSQSLSGIIT